MSRQMDIWLGDFGRMYTNRNDLSVEEMEDVYRNYFGVTRTQMNREFIGSLDRTLKILEVGSNIGNQLVCLQRMGFTSLYGIELQPYAVELSKQRTRDIIINQGTVFDIPYKDGYFDLIFTSVMLIHIAPGAIGRALKEIHRCSRRYIWGYEYFNEDYKEVSYRGNDELLWKANFPQIYLEQFGDLSLVKSKIFNYRNNLNSDIMFLLEKDHGDRID